MPVPLSHTLRHQLFLLWQRGQHPAALARHLRLAPRTVRRLCQAFARQGAAALSTAYRRPEPPTPSVAVQQALLLHQQHPTWGAPYLRVQLRLLHPELTDLPSIRTLQRWFRRHRQPPAPPGRKPAPRVAAASRAHEVWQMDAVEQLPLASSQQVSWLRWVDEFTGAVLGTVVFPHATFGQVPVTAVQEALRNQFGRWGLPVSLRVDNGVPWGNWNDLPTAFALWLIGLGVTLHWNDPGCPTQNPKIERAQGTGQRWSEPEQCHTIAQLQANLDEADRIHREEYVTPPATSSRLDLFPELRHSGRRYTRAWEQRTWSLGAVESFLAGYVATRKVGATGHITVYDHGRYVGQQYAGAHVQVQYDPDQHGWLIADQAGRELRRHPAPEITQEQIAKLTFRKPRQKK